MTTSSSSSARHGAADTGGVATHASRLRRFLAIDESDSFVAYAQTAPGRVLMAVIAIIAVAPQFGTSPAVLTVTAAMASVVWAKQRVQILFAATWVSAFVNTVLGEVDTLDNIRSVLTQEHLPEGVSVFLATGFLFLFLLAAVGILYRVQCAPQSLLARRPLIILLAVEAMLCGFGSFGLLHGWHRAMLWSAIFVVTPYLWFLPFAIADLRSRTPSPIPMQMSVLRPFWSPTYLPFGKGAGFLRKHLSTTPRDLAVTQLKAVKLLIWANILFGMRSALRWALEESMHISSIGEVIDAFLTNQPYPLAVGWAALVVSTARYSLQIAAWAHLFVGVARLAGYRLPRGSWRPLQSRTLMDYFNRFHYYFKELLVDLFFVPTFFKVFRQHPRLRMFFATFMAAGVGNAIWHFVRDISLVAAIGPVAALERFTSYAFYCVILATGVGVSQIRANLGMRPSLTLAGRLYSFFFVWSFVVCMHVFSYKSLNQTLRERIAFMASLFGVSLWI
jgi:hypothetical protein